MKSGHSAIADAMVQTEAPRGATGGRWRIAMIVHGAGAAGVSAVTVAAMPARAVSIFVDIEATGA